MSKRMGENLYPPFDDIPITTMTSIVKLDTEISLPIVFHILPVIDSSLRNVDTFPLFSKGTIVSLKYNGKIRGISRKKKKKTKDGKEGFKNSIILDFSIGDKNINVRISSSTIHVCGLTNPDHIAEVIKLLEEHFVRIDKEWEFVISHKEDTLKVAGYIRRNIRREGGTIVIPKPVDVEFNSDMLKIMDIITRFINIRNISDDQLYYTSCNYYLTDMDWIINNFNVLTDEFSTESIKYSMVNKNYHLGFNIDRKIFALIASKKEGWVVQYDPAVKPVIKISIPFDIGENCNIHRKKRTGKGDFHIFQIYRSGSVTQTGPNIELTRDAYNEFRSFIESIREKIEKKVEYEEDTLDLKTPENSTTYTYDETS